MSSGRRRTSSEASQKERLALHGDWVNLEVYQRSDRVNNLDTRCQKRSVGTMEFEKHQVQCIKDGQCPSYTTRGLQRQLVERIHYTTRWGRGGKVIRSALEDSYYSYDYCLFRSPNGNIHQRQVLESSRQTTKHETFYHKTTGSTASGLLVPVQSAASPRLPRSRLWRANVYREPRSG
jgi:hypothetical protein